MKDQFNPTDWLPQEANLLSKRQSSAIRNSAFTQQEDIGEIVQKIESNQIDITGDYSTWRNLGFALSDALGGAGRDYYHRISRFHPEYDPKECDKQFEACLKAKGSGITISTFFHIAKDHGILLEPKYRPRENLIDSLDITNDPDDPRACREVSTFPDSIFPQLPSFLKRVTEIATSSEERDILLLGSIVSISACLPKFWGMYDGKKCFPNLFLFVTAQASAGKGRLSFCKELVKQVHKALREEAANLKQIYELEMVEYNAKKGKEEGIEKPARPAERMLFIPANNSTTGVFQLLFDNNGSGLIFETEGDTLAQAFKSDYGNYSDGFRKAFHHETISYYRRTDREYVDIERPCLSTVLSGTPKQVSALIPSAENGLFSRFIFYYMNVHLVWKDVFADQAGTGLEEHFVELSKEFYALYKFLMEYEEVQFGFTPEQQQRFNEFFSRIQEQYTAILGTDYMATVRRLGLIAFRISMILTALRIIDDKSLRKQMNCTDNDFQISLDLISTLVQHSSKVFSELPGDRHPNRHQRRDQFFEALPTTFNRQKYLEVARVLNIPERSVERYITDLCRTNKLKRLKKDEYAKT
jgi:hypothetical protein